MTKAGNFEREPARTSRGGEGTLRRLTRYDWIFVFMAWLTCWYFALISIEAFADDSSIGFDFLPVAAGIPVVILGWRAVRLREQVDAALADLDEGAGLVVTEESSLPAFMVDLKKTVQCWGRMLAAGVGLVMVCGLVLAALTGDLVEFNQDSTLAALVGLLAFVMVGVGSLIGQLLGHLVGFGQLNRVMLRHQIAIAGLSTAGARSAMRSLESVFGFAILASMVMCLWFASWWVMWHLGFNPNKYADLWSNLFLALWAVSFGVFLLAGRRPALGFQRMIDALYGGAEMRRSVDRQLNAAQAERRELVGSPPSLRQQRELIELDRYIEDLNDRRFSSRLLQAHVLNGFIFCNIALLIVPWLLTR